MYYPRIRWRGFVFSSIVAFIVSITWFHHHVTATPSKLQHVIDTHYSILTDKATHQSTGNGLTVVVSALKEDDVSWLDELGWDVWKYEVNNPKARLRTPVNKGSEAMVYLTHIIEQYDNLTSILLFLHPDRFQWHNDDPNYDGLKMLKNLRVSYIAEAGYTSLRCHWYKGCPLALKPSFQPVSTPLSDTIKPIGAHPYQSRSHPSQMDIVTSWYSTAFPVFFPNTTLPAEVGTPCCAQFGVPRSVILANPKEMYERIRDWLMKVDEEDAVTGRVMEYIWHVLFGREAVHCPDPQACYCKLYGMCDLDCTSTQERWLAGIGKERGDCGVYTYPFGWVWFKSVALWKVTRLFDW